MNDTNLHIPLLPLLIGIVAGVLSFFLVQSLLIAAIAAAAGIGLIFTRFHCASKILAGIAAGAAATSINFPPHFDVLPADDTVFSGTVASVTESGSARSIVVNVNDEIRDNSSSPARFKARVTVPSLFPEIAVGDKISFSGVYSYPGRPVDIPLEDDLVKSSLINGISLNCFSPPDSISTIRHGSGIRSVLRSARDGIVDAICRSGCDDDTSAFLCAVMAGDNSMIDRESRERFAATGAAHVLALSGAHVAVITLIVSIVFFPLAIAGYRRMRWGAVIISLWGFAAMTGMSPSVVRAVIMATVVVTAVMIDRPRSSLNSLCLAAAVILVFDPFSLFKPGFQLSFLATAAIILLSPGLNPFAESRGKITRPVGAAIAVTVAATLGTAPLIAFYFHQMPVYFLAANLLMALAMPVMIAGAAVMLIISATGCATGWIADILNTVYGMTQSAIDAIASLPSASVNGIYFEQWVLIPAYATIGTLAYALMRRKALPFIVTTVLACITVTAMMTTAPTLPEGELFITRESGYTNIIIREGDSLTIHTTSVAPDLTGDSIGWTARYRDFIGSRKIEKIIIKRFDDINGSLNIRFGDKSLLASSVPDSTRADYLIVTKAFRGDIRKLAGATRCDTLLLSNDIHKRRHLRFLNELKDCGKAAVSLRDRPLSLAY